MKEITGDIWDYYEKGHWVVITTNGTVKTSGEAVMGRGVALQAKLRFPGLALELGRRVKVGGNGVYSFSDYRLFTLPVKHNWWEKANVELITLSLSKLAFMPEWFSRTSYKELNDVFPLYMVRPGCGNGGLDWKDVKPILEKYLDDRFVVVQRSLK